MSGPRVAVLALVALVLAGCGGSETPPASGGLVLELDHDELRSGAPVLWRLTVRNARDTDAVLVFRDGQDGDVVLSAGGRQRYRWSADRFFTQAVREVRVRAGESASFRLREARLGVEPGRYRLRATLGSRPAPAAVEREVAVR